MHLFILCCLAALAAANSIIRVDQEYIHDAPRSSWITIQLAHPGATIKSIIWCKSIMPNPVKSGDKKPPPIDDCKGPGLTHLQLYPARVRILPEEPNMVYIDPEQIGGWDSKHQFDIIVQADVRERAAELMQVVRFNPTYTSAGPTGPADGGVHPSTGRPSGRPVETQNPLLTPSSASTGRPEGRPVEALPTVDSPGPSGPGESKHPWPATFIVFGTGLCLLVALGLFSFVRRHRRQNQVYGSTAYEFDKLPSLSEAEEEEVKNNGVEMEDMSILMRLGKGANAAFEMNLANSAQANSARP